MKDVTDVKLEDDCSGCVDWTEGGWRWVAETECRVS